MHGGVATGRQLLHLVLAVVKTAAVAASKTVDHFKFCANFKSRGRELLHGT